MLLPLSQSIRQVGPTRWQIGSLVCERIETTRPAEALAAWEEHSCMYIMRTPEDSEIVCPPSAESTDELQLVHEGGSLSAVWAIGRQAFCKVKAWSPAMESEDKTIAFVKKIAPQISTPEVIYSWTDQDRSFLILSRIEGSPLRDAWKSLSLSQRDLATTTIALYCNVLAQNTSQILRSVSGKAILEPYLAPSGSDLLGPLTGEECVRYFLAPSPVCPSVGGAFCFYHPDLGPGNIIVRDGRVAGIIDWEAAGYYPLFWIATKPSVSPGLDFCPGIAGIVDFEWRKRLKIELEVLGYPQASGWYMKWRTSQLKG